MDYLQFDRHVPGCGGHWRPVIPHHQAGLSMAQAILALEPPPSVRSLAQSIVTSQQSEIAYLQALLNNKASK